MIPMYPLFMTLASKVLELASGLASDLGEEARKKALALIIEKVFSSHVLDTVELQAQLSEQKTQIVNFNSGFVDEEMDEVFLNMLISIVMLFGEEAMLYLLERLKDAPVYTIQKIKSKALEKQGDVNVRLRTIGLMINRYSAQSDSKDLKNVFLAGAQVMRMREKGDWAWLEVDEFNEYLNGVRGAYESKNSSVSDTLTSNLEAKAVEGLALLPNPDFVKTESDYERLKGVQFARNGVTPLRLVSDTRNFKRILLP